MARDKWKDCKIIIGSPNMADEDKIEISIHGEKENDIQKVMENAYYNALNFCTDAQNITEDSQMVLYSLSCELFFKAIIIKTQNRMVRGHDLHELFFELNENEQNYLIDEYLKMEINTDDFNDEIIDEILDEFENNLAINARLFEVIRYKNEYCTIVYMKYFLVFLTNSLRRLCDYLEIGT